MEMTQINLKIDKKTKEQAQMIYKNLGMNLSTALTVFLRQSIADNGMPFKPTLGGINSPESVQARHEAENGDLLYASSVEELKRQIEK